MRCATRSASRALTSSNSAGPSLRSSSMPVAGERGSTYTSTFTARYWNKPSSDPAVPMPRGSPPLPRPRGLHRPMLPAMKDPRSRPLLPRNLPNHRSMPESLRSKRQRRSFALDISLRLGRLCGYRAVSRVAMALMRAQVPCAVPHQAPIRLERIFDATAFQWSMWPLGFTALNSMPPGAFVGALSD